MHISEPFSCKSDSSSLEVSQESAFLSSSIMRFQLQVTRTALRQLECLVCIEEAYMRVKDPGVKIGSHRFLFLALSLMGTLKLKSSLTVSETQIRH
jgi:hypothetical protein